MAEIEYNKIKLTAAYVPALSGGTYQAALKQEVRSPVQDTLPDTELTFYVSTPRFTLREQAVYSVYPAAASAGEYSNTLPHVVLADKTYPWERRAKMEVPQGAGTKPVADGQAAGTEAAGGQQSAGTPWLALVCLNSQEDFSLRTATIEDVLKESPEELKKKGIYTPAYTYERETGEKESDPCMVLEVGKELYKKVFPRWEDLPYLAHGRQVDLHDCADDIISMDGCFSVITANRFPISSPEPGEKNSAFLISVEGYEDMLPGAADGEQRAGLEDYERFRFICLYTWDFVSVSNQFAGFRESLEKLKPGLLIPADEGGGEFPEVLKRGYVPLKHIVRTGENSVSLYRGPLAPVEVPVEKREEAFTADGELMYDPAYGLFDLSYSAAWQLGKLMVLRNQPMAKAVFQWRRSRKKKAALAQEQRVLEEKLSVLGTPESRFPKAQGRMRAQDSLMNFCSGELGSRIMEQELLGPAGDPTGRKKLEDLEE